MLSQFPYSALNNPGFPVGTWFELQFVVARWYSKSGPNNAGTLPREQMPPHRPLGAGFSVQRLESFCLANTCKNRQTKDFLGMDADCPATHAPPWWLDVKAMPKMDTLKERQKWLKGTAFCKSNFWLLRPLCGLKLCQQIWCVGSRQGLEDYSYYSKCKQHTQGGSWLKYSAAKSASSCYSVLYEGFPNFFKHPWPVCGLVILFLHVSHGLGFLVILGNWIIGIFIMCFCSSSISGHESLSQHFVHVCCMWLVYIETPQAYTMFRFRVKSSSDSDLSQQSENVKPGNYPDSSKEVQENLGEY